VDWQKRGNGSPWTRAGDLKGPVNQRGIDGGKIVGLKSGAQTEEQGPGRAREVSGSLHSSVQGVGKSVGTVAEEERVNREKKPFVDRGTSSKTPKKETEKVPKPTMGRRGGGTWAKARSARPINRREGRQRPH